MKKKAVVIISAVLTAITVTTPEGDHIMERNYDFPQTYHITPESFD